MSKGLTPSAFAGEKSLSLLSQMEPQLRNSVRHANALLMSLDGSSRVEIIEQEDAREAIEPSREICVTT